MLRKQNDAGWQMSDGHNWNSTVLDMENTVAGLSSSNDSRYFIETS